MSYNPGRNRRQANNLVNQSDDDFGQYDGFNMDESQAYVDPYGNQYYNPYPQQQVPQLFEDTSTQFMPPNDYYGQQSATAGFMQSATHVYGVNASNLINQQVIMGVGQQLLSNSMPAIDSYSQSIVTRSKSWIGSNVKYYFAVDTSYVLKKLLLIFFPFTHKDWSLRYNPNEAIAPKDDINAPDLYIPSMAFVTYLLVCGYILGMQNRFSPEHLGIQASSAFTCLLLEVVIVLVALYLLNMSSSLGFFHMISFGGYKFVCIVATLLASLPFMSLGYYVTLIYCSLSLGYFLLRSLHLSIQTGAANRPQATEPRNGLYLVLVICFVQPIVMYFLTRHFISFSTTV